MMKIGQLASSVMIAEYTGLKQQDINEKMFYSMFAIRMFE